MKGFCCDPLHIGCKKPTMAGISLTNTPHNRGAEAPCQSCRVRRAREERKAAGRPPIRQGHNAMNRL